MSWVEIIRGFLQPLIEGVCVWFVYRQCKDDLDCLGTDTCIDHQCMPRNISCNERKCLEGYKCKNNICTLIGPICLINADCPEHQLCSYNGHCYKPDVEIVCYDQVQCPSKYLCIENKCISCGFAGSSQYRHLKINTDICKSICTSESDCKENESCKDGYCLPVCKNHLQCPEGNVKGCESITWGNQM